LAKVNGRIVKVDPDIFMTPDAPADSIMGLAPFTMAPSILPGKTFSVLQNLFTNSVEHPEKAVFIYGIAHPSH
jgi:hypothetical protein